MSMAAKSSDLDDQKTGVNIQTEGHTLTPPSSQHGPEETETLVAPPPIHHHSPSEKPTPDHPWTLVLFGNTCDLYWRQGNYTTTPTCPAGASCGRHGLRWQIQLNRSSSDWPRLSCLALWVPIFRRRTELGWGARCHVHAVRSHYWVCKQPIPMPTKWVWVKAGDWSPKPSPNDTLNPEDPGVLTPFCLLPYHLTFAIRASPHGQQGTRMLQNGGKFPGMIQGCHTRNEAQHYKMAETKARGNETYGLSIHSAFALPHHGFKSDQFSINFLLSVIDVQ